ncbi:MAG: zinc ribbon domain-containing protein [Salinirussus sp.]
MSKITFRADDELVTQLEEFDASKSEVMRQALREFLGETAPSTTDDGTLDEIVAERVDDLIAERLDGAFTPTQPRDVNVNITLDGATPVTSGSDEHRVNERADASHESSNSPSHESESRKTDPGDDENTVANESKTCTQCGENLSPSHVYCPNCGEKSARRVFCDCGDELRSDWGFCPSCGRRTPAADVLDGG